jgi:superfamily II DNA or RNA helicase
MVTMDPLLSQLSLSHVTRDFGPPTVQRARGLERGVRISERSVSLGRYVAMGTVEGSRRYQTMVVLSEHASGVKISGTCSCPVAHQCKHAVAMCFVLMAEQGPAVLATRRPDVWADPLEEMLREFAALGSGSGARKRQDAAAAMALRFELDPTRSRYGGPLALTLRPLRVGKTGRWVKAGATWADVNSYSAGVLDDAQKAALETVVVALDGPGAAAQSRSIEGATPRIWAALERAAEAGVQFLGDEGLRSVVLAAERASVVLTVEGKDGAAGEEGDADGGAGTTGASVGLGVELDGRVFDGGELIPVGRRAHGALLLIPAEHAAGDTEAHLFDGVLVRFERPLTDRLSYMLRAARSVSVPGEGRAKLVDELLPRLARHVPVVAEDPAWRANIPEPPALVAVVRWNGFGAAQLAFAFAHSTPHGEELTSLRAGVAGPFADPFSDVQPVPERGAAERARSALAFLGAEPLGEDELSAGPAGESKGWPTDGAGTRQPSGTGAGTSAEAAPASGSDIHGAHARPAAVARSAQEEAEALEAFAPGPQARALLELDRLGKPRAVVHSFDGPRLIQLQRRLLPELREQIGVREIGAPPELRELSGDPEITFELAGEAPGGVDWLDLAVSIVVDGESVPLSEVIGAFTAGEEHVLLPSGAYVGAQHPVLARLAQMVHAAREVRRGQRDPNAVRVSAGDVALWDDVDELGLVNPGAERWLRAARALRPGGELPRVEPLGVVTELRDYQREGLDWLHFLHANGLGGVLADDMGLGKTLQVLSLISSARAGGSAPFLVVAPTSVVGAWKRQAAQHTPHLTVRTIQATRRRRGTSLAQELDGADVLVTSYTLLRSEAEEYAQLTLGGLILDEAQAIKNAASKTFQAVRGLAAPFALAVTGTPVENRIGELWPLLAVVAPGLYPTQESFTRLVVTPVERHQDEVAMERLRTRVRPFLLRRTKALVASALPPKQEEVLPVTLGKAHRHFYDVLLQRERQEVLGLVEDLDSNRVAVFAALTRLRLASLHAGLVDPEQEDVESAKLEELIPRLTQLAQEGHRALVFSQFTSFLGRIRTAVEAAGLEAVYLDGSTRDRAAVLDSFTEGSAPVFLISLKAGGVGLTLTEADYVFIMDPWWNPAVEAQAVDRAHRIGQERPVMVYRLVAQETIEEKVMALKEAKAELFDAVMGAAQATPTALGEAELRELFS